MRDMVLKKADEDLAVRADELETARIEALSRSEDIDRMKAEMDTLEPYIQQQEVLLPLLDPTFIAQHGFSSLDQAKRRIELLRPIIKLEQKEKEEKERE